MPAEYDDVVELLLSDGSDSPSAPHFVKATAPRSVDLGCLLLERGSRKALP
jgi:hypothetical protein